MCVRRGSWAEPGEGVGGVATLEWLRGPSSGASPCVGGSGAQLGTQDHNLSWEQGLTE